MADPGRGRQQQQQRRLPAAVEALSLSLPAARVPPETFRLAKFDRPQVSVTFWSLLYSLLKQIQGRGWMEPADTGAQVRFVKSMVLSHGYRRLEFYQLPPDGSEGSRELLLAFSWLLCRIGLVERLLTLSKVKPWDETIICMCDAPLKSLQDGRSVVPTTSWEGQRDVRYLQWLNGRLQFQWRSCHTEQQEHCKLLHKVHACTIGSHTDPNIGHFSVTEADAMRQPDNCKELLQLMEYENSQLEAFLRWKPLESVYWCWMETVLDPKIEDVKPHNVCNKDSILPSADMGCCGIRKIVDEIDRCRKDLMTLWDGLRELARCRKLGCCGKAQARKQEQLGERELCRAAKKAQEVVELKLSDLKCHRNAFRMNKMHGPYRLVFKGKFLKGRKMDHGRLAPNKALPEGITAADVICDLRKKEARLKAELRQRQEESRRKVQEAAEGLGQLLFIPPMRRREAEE